MEIYIMHNGAQLGPFSLENVRAQIDSGNLSASDYAWSVDIDDWTSLNDVLCQAVRDPPRDETRQEQRGPGRIGRALRVIRSFVERQLTPKTVVAMTVLLLVASWIYPPWVLNARSHGWFFVFDTTHNLIMQVDFGSRRLAGLGSFSQLETFSSGRSPSRLLIADRAIDRSCLPWRSANPTSNHQERRVRSFWRGRFDSHRRTVVADT